MKRRPALLLLAAAAVIAALVGVLVWATHSESAARDFAPIQSNYSVNEAKAFTRFPVYYAGEAVNGHTLTAVELDTQSDSVTFIYGDCKNPAWDEPFGEGGCAPPVQVQVWSACPRNPSLYGGPGSPTPDNTTVRGVPAAYYVGGSQLELQTGTSTVVIFADSPQTVAMALRGVNNDVATGDALPRPAAGAMTGDLKC